MSTKETSLKNKIGEFNLFVDWSGDQQRRGMIIKEYFYALQLICNA